MARSPDRRQHGRVTRFVLRGRSFGQGLFALVFAVLVVGAAPAANDSTASAAIPRWTGGVDLYRSGVFTTQKTWLWCTAADVQIMRNIVDRASDHSRASQSRYFDYMRAHDRYRIPVSDGTEPSGWTAGLRRFVDDRYRLVASRSFSSALRSAVTNLRKTNLPVGLLVAHGNHAWVLTGFTATADPAKTTKFTITSVRVVGPLWGLQSRSYGYDMRPDTKLTPRQLAGFFNPWHYGRIRMAWEGRWVSIQAIPPTPALVAAPNAGAIPKATATPTPSPTRTPTATPTAGPSASAVVAPSAMSSSAPVAVAIAPSAEPQPTAIPAPANRASAVSEVTPSSLFMAWLLIAVTVISGALAFAVLRERSGSGQRPTRRLGQ